MKNFIPVIGLEVHIELDTTTKMFCRCKAYHFGQKPNTNVCPVCLGLPGALPYANKNAVYNTIKFGLALNTQVATFSKFDRKHYFYPDLPKGYQISQYDLPLCTNGSFALKNGKVINIKRIHLEEDTGKLIHKTINGKKVSLVDYNRSGVPLMELVTEPDFTDPGHVDEFLKEIQLIVKYLEISDADMEKGSMRLEANISLKEEGQGLPNYKIELKNINSFKFLSKALQAEIVRQKQILETGSEPVQETRGYDEVKNTTFSQRTKEEAQDYRYLPEPDIPPITIDEEVVFKIKNELPDMPSQKREKYKKIGLSDHYIDTLISDKKRALYFEKAIKIAKDHNISAKEIASVMVNQNLDTKFFEPAGLIKKLLELRKTDYASLTEVEEAVKAVIAKNPKAQEDYNKGKTQVISYLIGQVQKILKGKGEIKLVQDIVRKNLDK